LASIDEGLAKKDAGLIVPAAHTIKSSSRQLGANKLADEAAELELAAKLVVKGEQKIDGLARMAFAVHETFDRTKLRMEVIIEEILRT
jgi:HPt (histidine-containing phosphotransfer) domain-containing protein